MTTRAHEIADRIHRISTPITMQGGPSGVTFNQYLVIDEAPLRFHTGPSRLFSLVREAVARVLPVERLRYVGLSHFEADECGSLNEWLAAAPQAEPVCGGIAATVSIRASAADRGRYPRAQRGVPRTDGRLRPHAEHARDAGAPGLREAGDARLHARQRVARRRRLAAAHAEGETPREPRR